MNWLSVIGSMFSSGGGKGGGGMFSGSSTATGATGSIGQDFSMNPVYNQSLLSSVSKMPTEKLAIVAVVVVVGAVLIWRRK